MAPTVREEPWAWDAALSRHREKEWPGLVGKAQVLTLNILLFHPEWLWWQGLIAGALKQWHTFPHECSVYLTEAFPEHLHVSLGCLPSPAWAVWLRGATLAARGCASQPQSQLPGTITGVTRFTAFSCVHRNAALGKVLDTHPNAVGTDEQQTEPGLLHFVNTCLLPSFYSTMCQGLPRTCILIAALARAPTIGFSPDSGRRELPGCTWPAPNAAPPQPRGRAGPPHTQPAPHTPPLRTHLRSAHPPRSAHTSALHTQPAPLHPGAPIPSAAPCAAPLLGAGARAAGPRSRSHSRSRSRPARGAVGHHLWPWRWSCRCAPAPLLRPVPSRAALLASGSHLCRGCGADMKRPNSALLSRQCFLTLRRPGGKTPKPINHFRMSETWAITLRRIQALWHSNAVSERLTITVNTADACENTDVSQLSVRVKNVFVFSF